MTAETVGVMRLDDDWCLLHNAIYHDDFDACVDGNPDDHDCVRAPLYVGVPSDLA